MESAERATTGGAVSSRAANAAEEAVDDLVQYAHECVAAAFDDMQNAMAQEYTAKGYRVPDEYNKALDSLYSHISQEASACLSRFKSHAFGQLLHSCGSHANGTETANGGTQLYHAKLAPAEVSAHEEEQLDQLIASRRQTLAHARSRYFAAEESLRLLQSELQSLEERIALLSHACPSAERQGSDASNVERALAACNRIERLISRAELADASLSEDQLVQQQQQADGTTSHSGNAYAAGETFER